MSQIINKTPHPIIIGDLTIAPTLPPARAGEWVEAADHITADDGTGIPHQLGDLHPARGSARPGA